MLVDSRGAGGRQRGARNRVAIRKRLLDVVVGGVLALASLPFILVLAAGVAVSLRAWPLFVQHRPGREGRSLLMVKLRTLPPTTPKYMDKHSLGLETAKLPWLCSLLRRTHLDELPQLFSVVAGHMSLVGPRPALPGHVEPVAEEFESLRRSVRPGCTGLWQLSVASSDTATSAPRFDMFYVCYASTRLDLWIMVRTVGWVLGLVKPIEIGDMPAWLYGPGLAEVTWTRDVPAPAAPIATYASSTPASTPIYPTQPTGEPVLVVPIGGVLAEVGD